MKEMLFYVACEVIPTIVLATILIAQKKLKLHPVKVYLAGMEVGTLYMIEKHDDICVNNVTDMIEVLKTLEFKKVSKSLKQYVKLIV